LLLLMPHAKCFFSNAYRNTRAFFHVNNNMPRERGEKKGEQRKGKGHNRKLEKGRNNVNKEEMENEKRKIREM